MNKEKNIFAVMEEDVLEFWDKSKTFEKSLNKKAPNGDYVFYDGPPFATGMPHYGHIVASVMKDAVPRYWTMKGYRVDRRWGWDCHGLPIENLAEKEMGLKDKTDIEKIGVEKFNNYCSSIVMRYAEEWKKVIKRMGRWVDMENDYKTMNPNYTESIWWVFKRLWDKGLIYKGYKAMHICPRCGTTLSNFEVTQGYKDIKDLSAIAKFELEDEPGTYILAWTTTPWTLIGNVALAINEDINYSVISINGEKEKYIIAEERIEEVFEGKEYKIVSKIKGKELIGKKYKPLFNYYADDEKLENRGNGWKIYQGNSFVTTEEGTGVVHIAPAFGEDDMNMGKEHNLPFIQHVDSNGRFKKEVSDWPDREVKPKDDHMGSDIEIIKYLAHNNLLFSKKKYEHSYPHCWRCDTPLLNYATESWFVEVTKIKENLIKTNKEISWVPAHMQEGRFGKWLEQARDWAISRNRYWGAPLPVWECSKCNETVVVGSREELKDKANKTLFIVRHGESVKNVQRIHSTTKNSEGDELTKKGEEETKKFAKELKDKGIEIIISSDFYRTEQTAEIIAKELGIKVLHDKRLREIETGDLNGTSLDEPESLEITKKRREGEDISFSDGENWTDLKNRFSEFYKELISQHANKKVLIVSHGDPIVSFEAMLISKDKDSYLEEVKNICKSRYIKSNELREIEMCFPDLHKQYVDEIEFNCKCGGKMKRIPEVLDCWFESGSMPYAQENYPFNNKKKLENNYPADFIAEGVDQTRGWFYTLHVLANALEIKGKATPAFKNVIVNGIVLAEDGQKMSKRLSNYPDPAELFNKYSVDAMRYYLLSSPVLLAENINFTEDGVKEVLRKVEMILWNVYKFYSLFAEDDNKKVKSTNILDLWILSRLNQLTKVVSDNMDNYLIPKAARPIEDFICDLSTWYVRRSRDRFKGDDEKDKQAALQTTKFVLVELSKIMAPFMPFIAEQLWQKVTNNDFKDENKSVHLESWIKAEKIDEKIIAEMVEVRKIVELGLAKRDEVSIKVRQPLQELRIANYELKDDYSDLIKDEVNVKEIISKKGDGNLSVELDTELTPELKQEGIKRELVRFINNLRKNTGMTIQDKAVIYWQSDNEEIKEVFNKMGEDIKKDTLSDEINNNLIEEVDIKKQVKVNGIDVELAIKKK